MQLAVRESGTAVGCARAIGRTGERGSASVEFVLVLPLVLLMCLALLQVGLLVKDQLVVQGAARAGAREGAVSIDDAEVRQAVVDAAVDIDPTLVDIQVAREGGAGSPVTVTVTYHAPVVVPLVSWLFPDTIDLSADAVMRQETDG
jgi:Flp pilus assembly protein TadG